MSCAPACETRWRHCFPLTHTRCHLPPACRPTPPPPPEEPKKYWTPSAASIAGSNLTKFTAFVNKNERLHLQGYAELYAWSVDELEKCWAHLWDFLGIKSSAPYTSVVQDVHKLPGARWFPGARVNFAENLLRFRDERTAFIFESDCHAAPEIWSYARVYDETARLAKAMRAAGVAAGDRVAGFLPNTPHAAVAMLASTSIGAIWASCSPDFGVSGALDRFKQIEPKVLFAADAYFFKGKRIDTGRKLAEIVAALPTLHRAVVFNYTSAPNVRVAPHPPLVGTAAGFAMVHFEDFVDRTSDGGAAPPLAFEQLPFDHPVYIMFSSGTTGMPKCIVQGPGVLLNQLKELVLHTDVTRDDVVFYYSTTGWMMWNWLIATLGTGAAIVLREGNPLHPDPGALWRMAERHKVSVFGTSARYLAAVMDAGVVPKRDFDLGALRCILSTGSPSTHSTYEYVYGSIKADVQFASISGGTDINGCFCCGCPTLPVYDSELQCRPLGVATSVWDEDGKEVVGAQGELVCTKPFPAMPLSFWGDDEAGSRYRGAYFEVYENVWRHGDFAELSPRGGILIYGRSDATLNPGGVRIGTADIYNVVDAMAEVSDSIVVGHDRPLPDGTPDVRVVIWVIPSEPDPAFPPPAVSPALRKAIVTTIRSQCSPRHVPAVVMTAAAGGIPYTNSGKKVELAVKKKISGKEVKNTGAMSNPGALDFYASEAVTKMLMA